MLVTQDHDAYEVLDTDGVQLAYRYLKTIQHANKDFENWKPQTATHYKRLVTSKVTLRGTIGAFSTTRNPKLHRVRNLVERPDGLKKVASASARRSSFDQTMDHDRERFLVRRCHRTVPRCPPHLIFSWIYRVRHDLDLQHEELLVNTFGRGTTGCTSFQSLLSA